MAFTITSVDWVASVSFRVPTPNEAREVVTPHCTFPFCVNLCIVHVGTRTAYIGIPENNITRGGFPNCWARNPLVSIGCASPASPSFRRRRGSGGSCSTLAFGRGRSSVGRMQAVHSNRMRLEGAGRACVDKRLQLGEREAIDLKQLLDAGFAVGERLHVVLDAVECNGHHAVTKADLCALKVFEFTIWAHAGLARRALDLSNGRPFVKRNARLADVFNGHEVLQVDEPRAQHRVDACNVKRYPSGHHSGGIKRNADVNPALPEIVGNLASV